MAELNFKQATDMRTQDIIEDGINSRKISQATKRREKLVKQLKEARDYDAGLPMLFSPVWRLPWTMV